MKLASILLISIGLFSLIFILFSLLIAKNCGWIEDLKLICYFIPDPPMAAALIGGAAYGWGRSFMASTFGFIVAIMGLLIAWISGFTSIYFGSDFWYGFMHLVPSTVILTLITSIAMSAISNHFLKTE